MVYEQTRIRLGEWDAQISLGFWAKTDHLISARKPDLNIIYKKKKKKEKRKKVNLPYIGFVVPVDNKGKIKEKEKRDKYLDLCQEK